MATELKGKVAVVTGGSRGIGFAVADRLATEGVNVVVCARIPKRLNQAVQQLTQRHAHLVHGLVADVRRFEDCRRIMEHAAEIFGGIDILVNNAGIGFFKPVDQINPEEWDELLATNLSGVFIVFTKLFPGCANAAEGIFFNISSLAGVNPFRGGAAYNASKFGLNGFSEAVMQDLRYDGIRVSYIMPGSVDTDFAYDPSSRPRSKWKLSSEDIAKAVVDLAVYPGSSLASRIELRPSQPPKK